MKSFLILLALSFVIFAASALVINFCRRRASLTSHGLTGMCHKNGGAMCSCCGTKLASPASGDDRGTGSNC